MGHIALVLELVVEVDILMLVFIAGQQSIVVVILYGITILPQQRELLLVQIIPLYPLKVFVLKDGHYRLRNK